MLVFFVNWASFSIFIVNNKNITIQRLPPKCPFLFFTCHLFGGHGAANAEELMYLVEELISMETLESNFCWKIDLAFGLRLADTVVSPFKAAHILHIASCVYYTPSLVLIDPFPLLRSHLSFFLLTANEVV